ncbi:MAG: beta-galactosidase, partial [Bryobacteraceae bacterium]|nr:beta-galactosidase [Bryobacteraceae bacterium]
SHIKLYPQPMVEQEFATLENIGLSWLRCDFAWYDLEPVEGEWDFSGIDLVVQEATERGISILGILGTSPSWANGGNEWNYPPTDMEAWRNYVRTVAMRYGDQVEAWEIWNEQKNHMFWQPKPDYNAYVNLLAAASQEIRAADPSATIVMGGVAGLDPNYLNKCLQLGAAAYVDAIAYHPYAETIGEEGQPPEATYWPKERLCRLIVEWVHNLVSVYSSRRLQVWVTEVGWSPT